MHHVVPRLLGHARLDPRHRRRTSASTTARCSREVGVDDAAYAKLVAGGVACEGEPPAKEEEE